MLTQEQSKQGRPGNETIRYMISYFMLMWMTVIRMHIIVT